ncbi:hypothetical protein BGW80DRAFT_1458958 [Lactifluus volemus]|nr:hypothetical protein BGW80DRAFT_1458958 [Lactifluus volemus]
MKSRLFLVLSVTFFVTLKGVAGFTVNTPANVAACEPAQLSWSGGTGPYDCFLLLLIRGTSVSSITSGANPNGPPLVTFPEAYSSPITWTVTFPANTQLDFSCRDSTGALGQSAPFTVQAGGASGSSAAAGTTAASPAAGSSAAATSGTTPSATNGNKITTSASASTPTTSAKSSSGNAAAIASDISYGVAGVLGAVVAAVLA